MRVQKVSGGTRLVSVLARSLLALALICSQPAHANSPPTAKNVSLSVTPNQSLVINVADVAFDVDGDPVSFTNIVTGPIHGNAGLDGPIYYSPAEGYVGIDSFEYEVTDTPASSNTAGATARGTVTLFIGVPIVPQATALNINVHGGSTQLARLNSLATLSITVTDEAGQPVAGANVAWSVAQTCAPAAQPAIAAQVCTDFSEQELLTDSMGIARAKLSIPSTSGTYDVTVSVSTVSGQLFNSATFIVVASNLTTLTRPGTPEAALADALDSMCRGLQASTKPLTSQQQELLARCLEILNNSDAGQVVAALRALAPEEVAAQARTGNSFAQQQLSNIGTRLSALRSGATGLGLAGLSFNIKGRTVPGSVFALAAAPEVRNDATIDLPQSVPKWSGFISGNVGGGDRSQTANEAGFDFHTRGLTAGADYRYSSATVFGGALGYARSDVNLDANGGGLDTAGVSLSLYGTYYRTQSFYLDAVLNYARNDYDQTRNIDYYVGSTHIQKSARSGTGGKLLALSVGGGYEFTARNGASAEVSLRLHRTASNIDGYTETGADALNLALRDQYIQVFASSVGTRGSWPLSLKWGVLIPQLDLSWEHELNDGAHQIKGSFVNDPFATPFAFKTDDPDRNYFQLGLGASAIIPGGKTAFLQYQTSLGRDHYRDYNVALGARVELR